MNTLNVDYKDQKPNAVRETLGADLKKCMKHVNTPRRQNAQLLKDFFKYTQCPVT
jgi:hypothetical protein